MISSGDCRGGLCSKKKIKIRGKLSIKINVAVKIKIDGHFMRDMSESILMFIYSYSPCIGAFTI